MSALAQSDAATPRAGIGRRPGMTLYVALTSWMIVIVLAGFWPYFSRLAVGRPPSLHWLLHVHAAVFSGWMILLAVQEGLAAAGRRARHMQVGRIGVPYGALLLVVGLVASFVAPALHVSAGTWTRDQAAAFLVLPLGDMLLFGGFFGAAIWHRRQPEIHKRLIILATVALMFAPVARFLDSTGSLPLMLVAWVSPVLIGMAHDLWRGGRVHGVYWLGLALLVLAFVRVPLMDSELWLPVGRRLLGLVV